MKNYILDNLNMTDIISFYAPEICIKGGRCVCPFHNTKKYTVKIYAKSFTCFVCGKSGDLFEFVMEYFNLSFSNAVNKIADDFGFSKNLTKEDKRKFALKSQQLKREKRLKEKAVRHSEDEKSKLCLLHRLELRKDKPSWIVLNEINKLLDLELINFNALERLYENIKERGEKFGE